MGKRLTLAYRGRMDVFKINDDVDDEPAGDNFKQFRCC